MFRRLIMSVMTASEILHVRSIGKKQDHAKQADKIVEH